MKRFFFLGWFLVFVLSACSEYTPKPRGYMRVEPVLPHYQHLSLSELPYTFSVSDQTVVELSEEQAGWINLDYSSLNAKIYCSYFSMVPSELSELVMDTERLVSRLTDQVRASAYDHDSLRVHGVLYELGGDVASPVQFYLTDSLSHFFRGALYYHATPNADSLAPTTDYLRRDIVELIQTFNWRN